jgi:predicted RNA-binding Zn-ribbon protein involved in translation (DUF1610 family)
MYDDGQIEHGHRFDATTNTWAPLDAATTSVAPAPSRGSISGVCSSCRQQVQLTWERRVIDWVGGLLIMVVVLAVTLAAKAQFGKSIGVIESALIGGAVGALVAWPIVRTRRYRCPTCGQVQRRART